MNGHGYSCPEYPIPAAAGIGFRFPYLKDIERLHPSIEILECHTENLFGLSASIANRVLALRADYAFSLHSIGLSLGSAEGVDEVHLRKIKRAVDRYEPVLVSDHVSWSRIDGVSVPDLLPMPFDETSLRVLCVNIGRVQDVLGRTITVENLSSYLRCDASTMDEASFLSQLAARTGCGLLIDLNNLRVNQLNFGADPIELLMALAPETVHQYHLAGPERIGDAWVDTHSTRVTDEVWELYHFALQQIGPRHTIVEWDQDLPALEVLIEESSRAAGMLASVDATRLRTAAA